MAYFSCVNLRIFCKFLYYMKYNIEEQANDFLFKVVCWLINNDFICPAKFLHCTHKTI